MTQKRFLSTEKLKLLELLRQEKHLQRDQQIVPRRSVSTNSLPLSFAQEQLWFHDQFIEHKAVYNLPVIIRLSGALSLHTLALSLGSLVDRHEALRTTFHNVEGVPEQRVALHHNISLPLVNLSSLDKDSADNALRQLISAEKQHPFDLQRGPLFRTILVRHSATEHSLLFTIHHIIADGWSLDLFVRELLALYGAFVDLQPSSLPELPVQYADFALWQRQWLQGEVLAEKLEYWSRRLADAPPVLTLSAGQYRATKRTFQSARETGTLPEQVRSQVVALSQREGVTLSTTLMAAFIMLLARYSGQNDIIVGSPVAGRNYRELEHLIGFFVNMLVLRTDVSDNPTFRELIQRVHTGTLGAYAHQDLPFGRLVEALQPVRDLSTTPLFQVVFTFQNSEQVSIDTAGLRVTFHEEDTNLAQFDLEVTVRDAQDGLHCDFKYNNDIFAQKMIRRMLKHFQTLVGYSTAHPELQIGYTPIVADDEWVQVVQEWGTHPVAYHHEYCYVHRSAEAWAQQQPDAIALAFQDQYLTYGTLNTCANQVAAHLQQQGVGAESLVGLCVDRSPEMVIGMLGILKAGAAYVPLDPSYPKERIGFILRDTGIACLLTKKSYSSQLVDFDGVLFYLDTQLFAQPSPDYRVSTVIPDHLAYVIYTSGSTGKPKGVQITHAGLLNLVLWHLQTYDIHTHDRATQVASMTFDACVWEVWPYLAAGASLHIVDAETRQDPEALQTWLLARQITVSFLPTPLAERVLELPWPEHTALRALLTGGDTLHEYPHPSLPFQLVNHYGPTEASVVTTAGLVEARQGDERVPSIGKPIANLETYVLDDKLQVVPAGVPGELYIAGEGLARGYIQHPELTAERFIPHPFSDQPGRRMYKTGDRVCYLPDGSLEFLGRTDYQVKLRGHRIEPGEIEATLSLHPAIHDVAVLLEEKPYARLVAYVALRAQISIAQSVLHAFLLEHMPEYMVPAEFVFVDALPLTAHGKIDRRALSASASVHIHARPAFEPPRSPLEELVCEIWQDVLKQPSLSIHENFFMLGGHSLLATQVVSRIRTILHIEIPVRMLFEAPTVALFAARLEAALALPTLPLLPPVVATTQREQVPLSFAQQRLWFLYEMQPESSFYNAPATIRLSGPLQVDALRRSLYEIVRRHVALRTTFEVFQEQPVQIVHAFLPPEEQFFDLSHVMQERQEEEVLFLLKEEVQKPFDVVQGPLLRTTLVCLQPEEHILFICMHHIICDGWSLRVFYQELTTLYAAYIHKQPSPLRTLPIQYVDFALWQRQWLQGNRLEQLLAYWQEQLANLPVLELPTDRPRPAVESFSGAYLPFTFPAPLTEQLKILSRREGVSLFMTLLAAFQVLLFRYSGQEDIVVGSPIANRTHGDLEDLIGFFVNMLVLRTQLSGDISFRQLLARVSQITLDAYAHQDLPFEKLVEALHPERTLRQNPLCQVVFVLQNAGTPTEDLNLSGLNAQFLEVRTDTAKFDLLFSLSEEKGCLSAIVEYNTDLFDEARIARMLSHFQTLLQSVVEHPEHQIGTLPLMSDEQFQALLSLWNPVPHKRFEQQSLVQLFDAQVKRLPDAVALVFEDEQLTYQALDRRANQLAQYMQQLGVGTETLVGICLERSLDIVICLLAILKAGGAYVPIDPAHPRERLAYMINDSQMSIILTSQRLKAQLPAFAGHVLCLDEMGALLAQQSVEALTQSSGASNLAYVIYTSGSTGLPKGVFIEQQNVASLLQTTHEHFHFSCNDTWTFFHSYAFDFSVWEIWGALVFGGRLVVVPYWTARSPEAFRNLLSQQQVTILNQTPSAFNQLIQVEMNTGQPALSALRLIIFGGEALDLQSLRPWIRSYGSTQPLLVNMYGITETTVHVTLYPLTASDIEQPSGSIIGQPLAGWQLYVLDRYLQPVPIGVPGELYVGGAGVARGYLERAELTAERFIPDPFSSTPGARLYKTGDLARCLPTGQFEYLGRIDHQLKIRGYRIELGEIEAVLKQHPVVRDAVVTAHEIATDDKRLISYITCDWSSIKNQYLNDGLYEQWVSTWQNLYDETYSQTSSDDPTFNIIGWNSSYTGEPLPQVEMQVWVESTVERIKALKPTKVLEIGCGTGLLLHRLAKDCVAYYGTDISGTTIRNLQAYFLKNGQSHINLFHQPAHDFTRLNQERFNVIILNSVVQYFPGIDYLYNVLRQALEVLEPGGRIFVGDVRSLPLLKAFHTWVLLQQVSRTLTREHVLQRVHWHMSNEKELVVDPAFFVALAQDFPEISGVHIQPKRGCHLNELTQFRYDVVIYKQSSRDCPTVSYLNWQEQGLSLSELRKMLTEATSDYLALSHIPNRRVRPIIKATELIVSSIGPRTAGAIVDHVQKQTDAISVDPEDLWELGRELNYAVAVDWSEPGPEGDFRAVFRRGGADTQDDSDLAALFSQRTVQCKPWSNYANVPLQGQFVRGFIPQLRQFLQERLPQYMLPAAFVMLHTLPLTPNGKIDRQVLPLPEIAQAEADTAAIAPRTSTEKVLLQIWKETLNLEQVSIYDSFFELGGHSLLATQAITRIRRILQINVPLRQMFETPSVAGLAERLSQQPGGENLNAIADIHLKINMLSPEEIRTLLQAKKK